MNDADYSRSSLEKENGQVHQVDVADHVPPVHDDKLLRKTLFKLDCIILTTVTWLYLMNFLDRANIGNAKAAGLLTDLGMNSHQYSVALTITYVPYIVAEFPLTMLIKILYVALWPAIINSALTLQWP